MNLRVFYLTRRGLSDGYLVSRQQGSVDLRHSETW